MMGAGYRGTYVISWAQTEIDGVAAAAPEALGMESVWSWSGEAVRVDGPGQALPLGTAQGATDLYRHAREGARRLIATALGYNSVGWAEVEEPHRPVGGSAGFTVTDGHRRYDIEVVRVAGRATPLLVFVDGVPPCGSDLWVVGLAMAAVTSGKLGRDDDRGVICFTPGTLIRAEAGHCPVETLRVGDRIETRDNGLQEIQWIGSRRITGARMHAMPQLRPIRFRAGALGMDEPDTDLVVSSQHRVLVRGSTAMALFRTDEVLVAAADLVNDRTIVRDHALRETTYIHLLTERHEVLWANGVATESFHPAGADLESLAPEARASLEALSPGLVGSPDCYGAYARRALTRPEAAMLLADRTWRS
jgi:hypothetical protein